MLHAPGLEPIDIHRIGQVPRRLVSQLSIPQAIQLVDHVLLPNCCMMITKPCCQPDTTVSRASGSCCTSQAVAYLSRPADWRSSGEIATR